MGLIKKIGFILVTWTLMIICHVLRLFYSILPSKKTGKSSKKVLFLAMFFPGNAGYNYRVKKWSETLEMSGYQTDIKHIFNQEVFYGLYKRSDLKLFLLKSYWIRFKQVLSCRKYDVVVLRRMLLPYNDYGNLFLDKLLLAINPNVILDFDDDLTNNLYHEKGGSLFGKLLFENRMIFYRSLSLYKNFLPGNTYLKGLIESNNTEVLNAPIIPTCVDYDKKVKKNYDGSKNEIILGWIGTNQNLKYLDNIIDDLNDISTVRPIKLHVISGLEYTNEKARFEIINRSWSLESEVEELLKIDIGLMPLNDDKISKGKCGFKLIQYMGLGIIPVASDVGVNGQIIQHGVNGFLVRNSQWREVLNEAISRYDEFQEMSKNAIHTVESKYNFKSNTDAFIMAIEKTCASN